MKNHKKKSDVSEQISIRKRVSLGRIIDTEQWLNNMAKQGLMLSKIEGRTFYFKPTDAEQVFFFMLSPEKGANSSDWIYYEFLENGGIRIPHHGTSHMSPNLVLKISSQEYQKNEELFHYYYLHRNYRLFHRLVSNILLSMFFFLLNIAVICVDYYLLSLLYICIGSLLVGIHNSISLFCFLTACRSQGIPATWKRPRRPGY